MVSFYFREFIATSSPVPLVTLIGESKVLLNRSTLLPLSVGSFLARHLFSVLPKVFLLFCQLAGHASISEFARRLLEVESKANVLELVFDFEEIGIARSGLFFFRSGLEVGVGIGDGFADEEGATNSG